MDFKAAKLPEFKHILLFLKRGDDEFDSNIKKKGLRTISGSIVFNNSIFMFVRVQRLRGKCKSAEVKLHNFN